MSEQMIGGQTAHKREDRERIPRALLVAMLVLVLASLAIASFARLTDQPLVATPEPAAVVTDQQIRIFGSMSGAAKVLSMEGELIADLTPDKGGFIAGVWRALARERAKVDVAPTEPVHIIAYENGRLELYDEFSGWRVELIGFGVDNAAAFQRLLRE